jgi:hypothetical protein
MGTRQFNRLSAEAIAFKKQPDLYCDGGGLYVQFTQSGSKTWIFRFRSPFTHKLRDLGLGPLHSVGLPEAREKASSFASANLGSVVTDYRYAVEIGSATWQVWAPLGDKGADLASDSDHQRRQVRAVS